MRSVNADSIRELFHAVRKGTLSPDEAVQRLRHLPFEDLGFAKVDHHRVLRHGIPEVIFGKGKTPDQVSAITQSLVNRAPNVLITRAAPETAERIEKEHPDAEHFPASGAIRIWRDRTLRGNGTIA